MGKTDASSAPFPFRNIFFCTQLFFIKYCLYLEPCKQLDYWDFISKTSQIHLENHPSIWIIFNWLQYDRINQCQMGAGFNCDKNKKVPLRSTVANWLTGRDEFWLVHLRCVQWISKVFFFSRGGLRHYLWADWDWNIFQRHMKHSISHIELLTPFISSLFLWCILWHFFLCLFTPFFVFWCPWWIPPEPLMSSRFCLKYACFSTMIVSQCLLSSRCYIVFISLVWAVLLSRCFLLFWCQISLHLRLRFWGFFCLCKPTCPMLLYLGPLLSFNTWQDRPLQICFKLFLGVCVCV